MVVEVSTEGLEDQSLEVQVPIKMENGGEEVAHVADKDEGGPCGR